MIELESLAAARVRKGDNVRTNNLEMTGKIIYASFRHDASRALDPQVHTHNVVVNVTQDSEGKYKALESVEMCRAIRYAGKVYHNELAKRCREFGYDMVNRRDEKVFQTAADFIEVGELREIELCRGDLILFNVNLRDKKIYNGNIAQITDDPRKVMMLYSDGTPRELIELPEDYATFKYGWVTTSHKPQGRTAENVVVAAQALDRKAFYVALSRGRKNMALHCPEKEFLKQQLSFRIGDRTSVHDLLAEGQISAERLLPLSKDAQCRKAETLPDEKYKSVIERTKEFMVQIKQTTAKVWERAKQIAARRSRWEKYGYGPISENTILEMDQERAISLAKEEALAKEKQRQAKEKPRKPLSKWHETMAWLADIGNGKNPPEPKPQQTSKPVKPQVAMPPFTFKSSVLRIGKPAEPSASRKKNSMQEALDFLAQESAKIQAKEVAEKARQEHIISYFKDVFNDDKDISKEIRNEISTALSPSRYFQSPVKLIIPTMAFIEIRDKWCCSDEEREKIRHEVFLTFSNCENVNICPFEENIMRKALLLNKYDCSFDNHDKYFIATAFEYESPLITSDEKIQKFQKYCNGKLEIKW